MMVLNTPDPVALGAGLRPDALAAIELVTSQRWSYRALDLDIQRAITALSAQGIGPSDRVAALAHNSVYLIILQQALMRMGAILVPLNWRLSASELARLLEDCDPKLLYCDREVPPLPEGCRALSFDSFRTALATANPAARRPPGSASTPCIILYTSGTSGTPKGALLTPTFLMATAVNFSVLGEVGAGATFLCDTPMFHVIGIVTQIWPTLLQGGKIVVSTGFDPVETNERLGDPELGVTHYFCVPQMANALAQAENFDPSQWRSLKALFTGGAPIPASTIHAWLDRGVKLVDGYGMTETGTTLGMSLAPELLRSKAGTVGLPGPLTAIRLVDEADRDVPEGTPGEILVRGLSVIEGYWNRPEERARSFTEDGWLRTGDIGRRDSDGYIAIVDRRKDMFISGGENVYPLEVETALSTHAIVREVAVIGIADATWGEVGCAFVVIEPGARPDHDALTAHCRALIAHYKVPKRYEFVETLPRTASGKVMKHVLSKQLAE
ncbi:acyl-CoA synthetase [Thioclava dalianensis]|uniref:3-methylmercaptopropionyl-CoA ligase n=1 Tax=Thioclava dalianensis TaxID=1185766 RepID=A0A074TLV5_9RHOB|nr:AMP-binding protein [Thioclava dalianensis]KEP71150.1 acyl-CoA synthetase [Thioclava dalianensis]SFN23923.1 fatty-acyl-CoA synthase [Thioclava dalianensis]